MWRSIYLRIQFPMLEVFELKFNRVNHICRDVNYGSLLQTLGAIHKLRHTNLMIFLHLPVLVTGGHISETPT